MLIFPEGYEGTLRTDSRFIEPYRAKLIKALDPIPVNIHCLSEKRPYAVTLITSRSSPLAKTYEKSFDGYSKLKDCGATSPVYYCEVEPTSLDDMAYVLTRIKSFKRTAMIRARHGAKEGAALWAPYTPQLRRWKKTGGPLVDKESYWLFVDIDEFPIPHGFGYDDVPKLVGHVIECHLPEPFLGKSCVWFLSNSAGLTKKNLLKVHLVFLSEEPISCRDYQDTLKLDQFRMFDKTCARGNQVFFTAAPRIAGTDDPFEGRRDGVHRGSEGDRVDLVGEIELARKRRKRDAAYRAEAMKRLAALSDEPVPTDPFERLAYELEREYESSWRRIASAKMGAGRDGYYNPIFTLICAAIERGEVDLECLKGRLRVFVWNFAEGRDPHKHDDISEYLSDGSLDRQITSALKHCGRLEVTESA